ncbi:uridine kinase [Umezawaea sp. NPDC059074]|uniref:uridine kinase family protein n=1 Tax=Umezawaea sp. NPDC059074 TaxID=3346716 RepID=UPI003685236D
MRLVAVDGPSGAGKSTVARALAIEMCATLISTDHFATWDNPVAWWPRLLEGVIDPLARGESGRYQRMDWSEGWPRLGEWVTVEPADVLIVEGVSSARRSIAARLDLAVWVDGPAEAERLERAVARDGEASREHLRRWQRFERGWFAVDGTRARADQVV